MDQQAKQPSAVDKMLALHKDILKHVAKDEGLANKLRKGFNSHLNLVVNFETITREQELRAWKRAREVLELGTYDDPMLAEDEIPYIVRFPALSLEARALRYENSTLAGIDTNSDDYMISSALSAMDFAELAKTSSLGDDFLSTALCEAVKIKWPSGWKYPIDPRPMDLASIARFPDDVYLIVAMYRIGGLADLGHSRPIVRLNTPRREYAVTYREQLWSDRYPGGISAPSELNQLDNIAELLNIYEQFWDTVLAKQPTSSSAQSRAKPAQATQPDYDEKNMLPAGKFPKVVQPRLRQATTRSRKSKHVRSIKVNGQTLYNYSDALALWPDDFKDFKPRTRSVMSAHLVP